MAKRKPAAEATAPPDEISASEYTVLARRYRPQQFADLVGQEPVAQALMNALKNQRVAHAYLFTGARGVGKTSAARILAKALNCEKGPTTTPCDQCDMCKAIATGEDMDVLEIDGASNRGIDEVREIRQNVQFRPSRGRYKVYIIDEVHMLTTPAFNALLKTLEEPPPHVKFIFATTEVQKIPITILSRCQRFDFAGIGTARIVERLRQIVTQEKMQAEDEALQMVARRAGGSMRDAQSLLDQLLAFGQDKLTTERVHQLLGTANEDRISSLAQAILDKQPTAALGILGQVVEQGQQLGELLDQLTDYWRDLMVVQCTGDDNQALSVAGAARQQLKKQAEKLDAETILAGIDILVATKNRLRGTMHGRVLLEMALVRLCRLENLVPLAQLAQWVAREGAVGATPSRASAAAQSPSPASVSIRPAPTQDEKKKELSGEAEVSSPARLCIGPDNLPVLWSQVVSEAGFAITSELRKGEVAISGPNSLVLRVPPGYNLLLDSARQTRLDELIRHVFGAAWVLRIEASGTAPLRRSTENGQATARRLRSEVAELPLVKKAMDLLGAQIVHVDENFGATPAGDSAKEAAAGEDEES